MPSTLPTTRTAAVVLAAAAIALAGCRHARKTAAVPATVPSTAVATKTAPPETKVASPATEFTTPAASASDVSSNSSKAIQDAFFDFNSAAIRPDAAENLQSTAQWLRSHRSIQVEVEGHCDERGTEQYNLALGEKRAYSAKEYLSTLGIDPQRVSTISYGKDKPFDSGHDEAAWASNRRAHIVLTATKQQR